MCVCVGVTACLRSTCLTHHSISGLLHTSVATVWIHAVTLGPVTGVPEQWVLWDGIINLPTCRWPEHYCILLPQLWENNQDLIWRGLLSALSNQWHNRREQYCCHYLSSAHRHTQTYKHFLLSHAIKKCWWFCQDMRAYALRRIINTLICRRWQC